MSEPSYDFLAVGLGPFNLGLACLAEPVEGLNGLFVDERPGFDWHPGMMLDDATLQTPFLSDLVTLADPTHPLSFLNYIKRQGRIYAFYIRENFFLLRREYNQYCQWATRQLNSLRFNTRVDDIRYDDNRGVYVAQVTDVNSGSVQRIHAKKLVLGTGPKPWMPACCAALPTTACIHSGDYLKQKAELQRRRAITIVGSGQSAAEIFHDLLNDIEQHHYRLNWVTRSPRFFPLEYTKLTLEMTSPEYVDYFFNLPPDQRDALVSKQTNLYKGINSELINAIYDLLYQKQLLGQAQVQLLTNTQLQGARWDGASETAQLALQHEEQGQSFTLPTGALVMATGYRYQPPAFLGGIEHRIRWDQTGRFDVHRNYSIDHAGNEIFVQNAELHTHGFVTPDLGMACYRNTWIIRELTGVEHYPIETQVAFQSFGVPVNEGDARLEATG